MDKIDAAYETIKAIYEYKSKNKKIDLIMNLGSAVGNNKNYAVVGAIIICKSFMQLDFDLTGFDDTFTANINELKIEDDLKPVLESRRNLPINWLPDKPCDTTDTFSATSDTKCNHV